MDSPAFKIWSTVLALMLVIIWLSCMSLTIVGVASGVLLGHPHGWKKRHRLDSQEITSSSAGESL